MWTTVDPIPTLALPLKGRKVGGGGDGGGVCGIAKDAMGSRSCAYLNSAAILLPPLQGEGWGGDGVIVLGQSNKTIKSRRLPQQLRRTMTDAERKLWRLLRLQQFDDWKFRRQHVFGNYVLDFVCLPAKLVVEVDGGQHADAVAADDRRSRFLMKSGFRVVRFWNNEVLLETEAVTQRIWDELQRSRTPSPPCPSP